MRKRVSVVVVVLLMASPVYATFYGYWLNQWEDGPISPIYTNHHNIYRTTTNEQIAEILGRGEH